MSKLAHSNDETMAQIEADRHIEDDMPNAETVIRAIANSGHLSGHPDYLTKLQIVALCQSWLRHRPKVGNNS